jgi:N-acetylmuramoyl-L-alanine amidase
MSSNSTLSRRRLLATAAGGAIVASTGALGLSPAAGARSSDRMQVNVNGLRLRTGPGTGYGTITSLAKGTIVQTLEWVGKANGYDWVKVKVESTGKVGYVASQLLAPLADSVRPQVKVASGPLRVRSAPGLGGSVRGSLPTGARGYVTTEMPVTKDGYVWINVVFNSHGLSGWVAKNFLTWI